jgi:two-component system response regulator
MSIESTLVLIVDDSPTDAELTMHALRRDGVSPCVTWLLSCEDVEDHFERLNEANEIELPHLILLDTDLPRGSGIRVLERLKSNEWTRSVPVVMLSSYADEFAVRRCYELGANSCVVKPLSAVRYIQAVSIIAKFWLNVNRYVDSRGVSLLAHFRDQQHRQANS